MKSTKHMQLHNKLITSVANYLCKPLSLPLEQPFCIV